MRVMEIKEFGTPEMLVPSTRLDLAAPVAGTGEGEKNEAAEFQNLPARIRFEPSNSGFEPPEFSAGAPAQTARPAAAG